MTGRDLVYLVYFSPPLSTRTSLQAKRSVLFFYSRKVSFLFLHSFAVSLGA